MVIKDGGKGKIETKKGAIPHRIAPFFVLLYPQLHSQQSFIIDFTFMRRNNFYREKKYFSSWKEFENKLKSTSPNSRFSLLFTLVKHAENDKIAAHRLSYPALNLLDYSKDIGL